MIDQNLWATLSYQLPYLYQYHQISLYSNDGQELGMVSLVIINQELAAYYHNLGMKLINQELAAYYHNLGMKLVGL